MDVDYKVLLVEDDKELAGMVSEFLLPYGFEVSIESRGDTAIDRIGQLQPDALILDVNLPGKDGFSVCREIRPQFKGPILILTARGEEADEVYGLEVGADDYMAKPVRPAALLARLKTHLKKMTVSDSETQPEKISAGKITIDSRSRSVLLAGVAVELTTAEFDLLWLLAERAGEVISRKELYFKLNGFPYDGLDRSIDLRVSRLRKKLDDDPNNPELVMSVRGVGYQLAVHE